MDIYGIASAQVPDRAGELVKIDGMKVQPNAIINDEHTTADRMFNVLGHVKKFKKILSEKDCEDQKQIKCWKIAKAPFLYVEGSLSDEQKHPNAMSAAANIAYAQKHPGFNMGFSVEGTADKREGNVLAQTTVQRVSLTVSPCNPVCKVFIDGDVPEHVAKSSTTLMKSYSPGKKSFNEIDVAAEREMQAMRFLAEKMTFIADGLEALEKSHKANILRCWQCGTNKLIVIPSHDVPNECVVCGEKFSMDDINKCIKGEYNGSI